MSRGTILHLFGWDKKFVLSFRDLIHEHFADGRHRFVVYGDVEEEALPPSPDTVMYSSLLKNVFTLSKTLHQAEKVILHGLFSSHLLYLLALQPWLLKKCYWVMWGGDFYVHEDEKRDWRWRKNEFFRRVVIGRVGYLLTYVIGDVELARQWYGAKGKYLECLMYPSNIFAPVELPEVVRTTTTVLVGNSAASSNNHFETFERLSKLEDQNFTLICPLSYGDKEYAKEVAAEGKRLFADRFVALIDFMPYPDYLKLLAEVDIAVFAHKRQQGMGNTITLLGLGKKVYMRNDVTPWAMFDELGVKVFDVRKFDLMPLNDDVRKNNQVRIKSHFSEAALAKQLHDIFEG